MEPARMPLAVLDQLAREGGYVWDNQAVGYFTYDVAGYERVDRKDTPFGRHEVWDLPYDLRPEPPTASGYDVLDRPYLNRLSGVHRGTRYSPDEFGRLLRDHGMYYVDDPGEGLLESLMMARKYGLRPTFSLPAFGLPLVYTRAELERHEADYAKALDEMVKWLRSLEPLVGRDLTRDPEQIWLLYGLLFDDNPFIAFVRKYETHANELESEFQATYGFRLPVASFGQDPMSQAQRVRFWEYIRRRYAEVIAVRAEVARKKLAGRIVGNAEFDNIVDYLRWGKIFDMPGVNARPLLMENELGRRYWVGYAVRLASDLMNKPPMVSVRINVPGAGARVIPTPNTIKALFSQAIQNGAAGFYHWLYDFAADSRDPHAYSGPAFMNPDGSTLPTLRWNSTLEISRTLSRTRVFMPPPSEVGVFVSTDSCSLGRWKRIFSAYIELVQAGIWHRFVSDQEAVAGEVDLASYKVLFVPVLPFVRREVAEALERFVGDGGVLICFGPDALAHDIEAASLAPFRERLFGVLSVAEEQQVSSAVLQWPRPRRIGIRGRSASLTPNSDAQVCGEYPHGKVAAVMHRTGNGLAILVGFELMDSYDHGADLGDDAERFAWYRDVVRHLDLPDRSWVWKVSVENVRALTGESLPSLPEPDERVEFCSYMYRHGEPAAHPDLLIRRSGGRLPT